MYLLISINCRYSHSCLASLYIRQALNRHLPEVPVKIKQFTLTDPYYKILLEISTSQAAALFFSVYIWNHHQVRRLVNDLHQIHPDLPIILGGPQAEFLGQLPKNCSLVLGPVEGLAPEFFHYLRAGRLTASYQAAAFPGFSSPYQGGDFDSLLAHRYIYYESSRGCPFSCSYCLSAATPGVVRRELEAVKNELCQILTAAPQLIKFVDRTFNDLPERSLAIWRFLINQPGSTRFHFEIAPDRFTPEMFDFLETVPAGRFQFEIGVQSFNPHVLAAINRRMSPDKAASTIRSLSAMDTIHVHADLILGLPGETRNDFLRSFDRLFALAPHHIQMGLLKILPGTAMRRQATEKAMLFCEEPPYEILATPWMDHTTLAALHALSECVEAFYNNRFFRSFWQYLRTCDEPPSSFFLGLLAHCREHDLFNRAPTQTLLTELLTEFVRVRSNHALALDLLRFDWLRCGYRNLPECLRDQDPAMLRRTVKRRLPTSLEPLYTSKQRDAFLRKHAFLELPATALQFLGFFIQADHGLICFAMKRSDTLDRHHQAYLVAEYR